MSIQKSDAEKAQDNKFKFKLLLVVVGVLFLFPLATVGLLIYAVARKKGDKNESVE